MANGDRIQYIQAVLSEIRMLIDFVAGNTNKSVAEVKVAHPASPDGKPLAFSDIIDHLDRIEDAIGGATPQQLQSHETALIYSIRDALGALVRPASGLSVAYTALVAGHRRSRRSGSRAMLAAEAYPGFRMMAVMHRYAQRAFILIALGLTVAAVWESAKVALGKSLLQNVQILHAQQTAMAAEKAKLENTLDKSSDNTINLDRLVDRNGVLLPSAIDLCNRKFLLQGYASAHALVPLDADSHPVALHGSPAERELCERDHVLATNLLIAKNDLGQFMEYWPIMAGSFFDGLAQVLAEIKMKLCALVTCMPSALGRLDSGEKDIELRIAPLLLVWGNYVLPVIFGFLGATIYVILDFFGKIRDSLLYPRDNFLCWIRLVLGLVTGTCMGLFFSSSGPSVTQAPWRPDRGIESVRLGAGISRGLRRGGSVQHA